MTFNIFLPSRILLLLVFLIATNHGAAFSIASYIKDVTVPAGSVRVCNKDETRLCSSKMNDEEDYRPTSPFFESPSEDSLSFLRDNTTNQSDNDTTNIPSMLQRMRDEIPFLHLFTRSGRKKLPPLQVDDVNVMLYDVFLIVNLSLSISFWVTHRLDFSFVPSAFNEGCLFSILWIASGLYHGSFLYSAMDGHFPIDDQNGRGGPKDAAALAFNTYINAINLRLVAALIGAWLQHRKVGVDAMEELIPLEIGCGLVLMTLWRALHSSFNPRV
jgi:hypothetical protein